MDKKVEILGNHLTANGVGGFVDGDRLLTAIYGAMDEYKVLRFDEVVKPPVVCIKCHKNDELMYSELSGFCCTRCYE